MEQNKIIRRQGIYKTAAYAKVVEDFTELFEDIEGVSVIHNDEIVDESGAVITPKNTIINLDSNNHLYIKIASDENLSFRVSLHCGKGDVEGSNRLYIDSREKSDYIAYNMAKTPYGVAFSTFPNLNDAYSCVSDGYFQNYFTTFEDENGNEVKTFIFVTTRNDETASSGYYYICGEKHSVFEKIVTSKIFLGTAANHTIMINASAYGKPHVARHLYKKIQSENSKFGKIKLNGKTFIAGSHFCLECEEE